MNHKKSILLFFVIVLVSLGMLPVLNFIKKPDDFSVEKMFNTDIVESFSNHVFLTLFNRSLRRTHVITGKDDFLFLGEHYNHIIHQSQNLYPHKEQDIENWVNHLADIQQWYKDKGIDFLIAVVPNKHTVYSDKLPNWIIPGQTTIAQKLIKSTQQRGMNIVDLSADLMKKKHASEYLLYDKKGSHWSDHGTAVGYEAIIDGLNNFYQNSIAKVEYHFQDGILRAGGLQFVMKVIDYNLDYAVPTQYYHFTEKQQICQGTIDKKTNQLQPCSMKENQPFRIHIGPSYVVNEQALNDAKVLLLADSFSTQNARLFNRTFKTIWKFHYNLLIGNDLMKFVEKHKPDIVIYQIVERGLYENQFINTPLY